MPYTRLPLAHFQALYPQFSTLTNLQYDAWADKIEPKITDRYGDDQQDATELEIAHALASNGVGIGAAGAIALTGTTSFKSGTFSATVSDAVVQQRNNGGYDSTIYGQRLIALRKRLFAGPFVTGTGTWTC